MMLIPVMMLKLLMTFFKVIILLFVMMLICAMHTCYDADTFNDAIDDTFTDAYIFTDAETVNDSVTYISNDAVISDDADNSVPSSSTHVSLSHRAPAFHTCLFAFFFLFRFSFIRFSYKTGCCTLFVKSFLRDKMLFAISL